MKRKSIFTLFAAAFMVLAFSAMALAANQVNLKTTVPNIPKSTCYQAGTDTMVFDDGSTMEEGDVVTFTLNNNVTICKEINYFVTFAPTAGTLNVDGTQPVSAATAGAPTITAALAGTQWGFLVKGPVGSQIITLTLRRVTTGTGVLVGLTPGNLVNFTGAAPTDKLVVKLFDGKTGVWAESGIQKYSGVANTYNTAILAEDNALCINTLTPVEYMGEYVQNTPNSVPVAVAQKLNFTGDYVIAHIMAAQTFNLVTCKDATCGSIVLGTSGQTSACTSFNYETIGANPGNPYCSDHTAYAAGGFLPKFIIQTSQEFQLVPYTVTAEIRVNGAAGEHGVYWSSTAPAYATSDSTLCGTTVAETGFAGQTYYKADGSTEVAPADLVGAGSNNCSAVKAAGKAVSFKTDAEAIFSAGDFFFELNLPPFVYNLAEVNPGDVVSVHVTLSKATCGSYSFDLCMGTFVAKCSVDPTKTTGSCILPFVASLAAGDTYWNGIAISNNSSTAGTVTLTAYKADNTTATATVSVPAKGIVSGFVYDTTKFPWTGTTPAGVPAYIQLQSTGFATPDLNAFVFMSDSISTTDATSNSMGYTCVK